MKILAVDVGTGTQDILLFDSNRGIENCFKMVMPSPTVKLANAIRSATQQGDDIVLTGVTMGGGPCSWAVSDHLKAGCGVYATRSAARTFNDDLDAVVETGVTLVTEDEVSKKQLKGERLHMADFDYEAIASAFGQFDVDLDRELDGLAVAVFDHGNAPPNVSDRLFRFQYLENQIRTYNRLSALGYRASEVPSIMTRMQSTAASIPPLEVPVMLMDTAPAAVMGALLDSAVQDIRPVLVVNVGNFHCLAFRFGESGIEGMFEHHTGEITRSQLEGFLDELADGSLQNDQVFNSNGHGAVMFSHDALRLNHRPVVVTGPRREILRESRHTPYFAAPFGDMMLAGCYGLIQAYGDIYPESSQVITDSLAASGDTPLW